MIKNSSLISIVIVNYNCTAKANNCIRSIMNSSILNNLKYKYEFIGSSMKEDFYFIGNFQYRILSSSTFALWASALGLNDRGAVIAPKYWLPNKKKEIYLPNE